MTSLTAVQVYRLARGAGLGSSAAVTATAIAFAESAGHTDAVGDTSLTDATWGPSIGLWQIRSVKAENGTGRSRDASRLRSPEFNAASMAAISSGGSNWSPWSTYKNGAYKAWVNTVQTAVGGGLEVPPSPSAGNSPVSFNPLGGGVLGSHVPNPLDWGDALGDLPGLAGGAIGDKAGDLAAGVVALLVKALAPAVLIGAGLAGGMALIAIGAWRGTEAGK